ncbi:MAG TPA: TonB family protein [Terriglobales bacterium]|nr:TonB family protein [Terriglobales bacterium]
MSATAAASERLIAADDRRARRKSVGDSDLITVVELKPFGFALLRNVSETGIGVDTLNSLTPGQDQHVSFLLPDSPQPIECTGEVRWATDNRAGLRLTDYNDDALAALRKWISKLPDSSLTTDPCLHRREFPRRDDQLQEIEKHLRNDKLKIDVALEFLAVRLIDATGASGAAIALGDASNMVCCASVGLAPEVGVAIESGSGLTGECIRTRQTIYCEDTEKHPGVDREVCRELNLRCSLIVPVLREKEVAGVLELFSPKTGAFADDVRWLVERLAALTAEVAFGLTEPVSAGDDAPEFAAAPAAIAEQPPAPQPLHERNTDLPLDIRVNVEPSVLSEPEVESTSSLPENRSGIRYAIYVAAAVAALAIVILATFWRDFSPFLARANQIVPAATSNTQPAHTEAPITEAPTTVAPSPAIPAPSPAPGSTKPASTATPVKPATLKPKAPVEETAPDRVDIAAIELPRTNGPLAAPPVPASAAPEVTLDMTSSSLPGLRIPVNTPEMPKFQKAAVTTGGKLLHEVKPRYPEMRLQQGFEGDVTLVAHIAKTGRVTHVRLIQGDAMLGAAAAEAIRQWRYEPFKRGNEAEERDTTILLQFRIPKS